jgi:ribosomal protein L37E
MDAIQIPLPAGPGRSPVKSSAHDMHYHCPNCNEIVYDRNRKVCGICGTALLREVVLCAAQAENQDKDAAESAEGHKRNRSEIEAR